MTDTITAEETVDPAAESVARGTFDLDWNHVGRLGALLGLALWFITLSGMPVALDGRLIIDGVISLGYVSLIAPPFIFGWTVGNEVVLEGMVATKRGPRDLVAGAAVGALGGVLFAVLIVLIDNFDIRDPLVNWSPDTLALLTFDKGVGFGILIWILLSAGLGAAGASLRLLPPRLARAAIVVILSVLSMSIFQAVIDDLLSK